MSLLWKRQIPVLLPEVTELLFCPQIQRPEDMVQRLPPNKLDQWTWHLPRPHDPEPFYNSTRINIHHGDASDVFVEWQGLVLGPAEHPLPRVKIPKRQGNPTVGTRDTRLVWQEGERKRKEVSSIDNSYVRAWSRTLPIGARELKCLQGTTG